MNSRASGSGSKLYFSRWNRKRYAVFASLGCEVRIGVLALYICEMSLRKSSRKGGMVHPARVFGWVMTLFEEHKADVVQGVFLPVRRGMDRFGYLNSNDRRRGVSVYE